MYPALPSTWTPDAGRPYRTVPAVVDQQSPTWRTAWQNTGWPASASSSSASPMTTEAQYMISSPLAAAAPSVHRRTQSSQHLRQQYWHDKSTTSYSPFADRANAAAAGAHTRHVSDHLRHHHVHPTDHPYTPSSSDGHLHASTSSGVHVHTLAHPPPPITSDPTYARPAVHYHGMPVPYPGSGEPTIPSPTSHIGPTRSRSMRSESDREEANRQKSKRHYDRKKVQRAALADLTAEYAQAMERLRVSDAIASRTAIFVEVAEALALRLPGTQDPATPGCNDNAGPHSLSTVKRANERKRLNKLMQRQLEMQRIQQLSRISRCLEAELRRRTSISLLITATEAGTSDSQRFPEWASDPDLRAAFYLFQPWLVFRATWANLLLAEERLSLMAGRPLARMVTALRALVNESRPTHHRQISGTSAGTDTSSH